MHQYIFIYIIYWKNKQQCNQLQYKQQCPTSLNMKNHSAEQKSCDKKGSRAKKLCCKKIAANLQRKMHPCVNSTIEIALEQIQCDITANLQHQNCSKFALCVSRHLLAACTSVQGNINQQKIMSRVFCLAHKESSSTGPTGLKRLRCRIY